ncbi:MAG: hypothetical protein D6785_09675 [Planctomycetota bacterium]|nr:MAG: hypothetical protein D6785_09675 [Planctomycetota bacterium]
MGTVNQKGIILLSTLFIVVLLSIIIFQYIYSTTVESIVAGSQKEYIQNEILLQSALAIGKAKALELANGPSFSETTLEIPVEEGGQGGENQDTESNMNKTLSLKIKDETGKFNLNAPILASSEGDRAFFRLQLERLLLILSQKISGLSQHTSSLYQLVESRTKPFVSLRDLENASTKPGYALIQNLERFFTVHHGTRINIATAPIEVIQSLAPSLSEEDANLLRQYFLSSKGPKNIQNIGKQVDRFTTLTSHAFLLEVELKKGELGITIKARYEILSNRKKAVLLLLERNLPKKVEMEKI